MCDFDSLYCIGIMVNEYSDEKKKDLITLYIQLQDIAQTFKDKQQSIADHIAHCWSTGLSVDK